MAENDSSQWPRHPANRKDAENRDRAGDRIKLREEQPVENGRRDQAVQQKVEPFDAGSNHAGNDHAPAMGRDVDRFVRRCLQPGCLSAWHLSLPWRSLHLRVPRARGLLFGVNSRRFQTDGAD
jgi:hypothetical protein